METTLNSSSPADTQEIGRRIGGSAQPGDIVLLVGELGSGKTTITQGILWGLGGVDHARSPTFVLVNEYPGRLTLYHMDLYRLESVEEIEDLGLEDYLFGDGLCVVEWADKAPEYFPVNHVMVRFEVIDDYSRAIRITTPSSLDRLGYAIKGIQGG